MIPLALTNAFSLAVAGAVTQTVNQSANQFVQNHSQGQNQNQQVQGQGQVNGNQQHQGQSQIQTQFQNNFQNQIQSQLQNTFSKHFLGLSTNTTQNAPANSSNPDQSIPPFQSLQSSQPASLEQVSQQPVPYAQITQPDPPAIPSINAISPPQPEQSVQPLQNLTSQPVYYQAPGTVQPQSVLHQNVATPASAPAPLSTVPTPASHTNEPSTVISSDSLEPPKLWANHSRAGHFEVDEKGEEKYIPKPAPDVIQFAPPPVRRDRVDAPFKSSAASASGSVGTAAISAQSTSGSRPLPNLPARNYSIASSHSQASVATVTSTNHATPSQIGTGAQTHEHKPIKFVDIDISKLGPPPPLIYRGKDANSEMKKGSRDTHVPKLVPSASPQLSSRQSAAPASEAKKTPPPKPAKPVKPPKPQISLASSNTSQSAHEDGLPTSPPPPYEEMETAEEDTESAGENPEAPNVELVRAPEGVSNSSGVPNFAAQIAKLRSVNGGSKSLSDGVCPNSPPPGPTIHRKEASPPNLVKPLKLAAPSKPPKPEIKKKPEIHSVKPNLHLHDESSPPPSMPVRPQESEEVAAAMLARSPGKPTHLIHSVTPTGPPPKPAKLQSTPILQNLNKEPPAKPKPPIHPKPRVPAVVPRNAEATNLPSPSRSPAPPPPPSRSASAQKNTSLQPPPPPPRNYHIAAASTPKATNNPPDLDLELSTGWYTNFNSLLQLPKALAGLNYSSSYLYSTKSTPMGNFSDHTRQMAVTLKDLSKMTYNIHWKNNDPSTATSEIAKFVPSPLTNKPLTKQELVGFSQQFGDHVAAWCLHREGEQVGSGECWDLAYNALLKGCGKHAFVSTYYHHGYPILEIHGSSSGSTVVKGPEDEIRRGDILQFTSAKFENRANGSSQTAGDPHHTSVVFDKIGDLILVAEQNVQGLRKVRRGEYTLANITSGSVVVYRPVSAQWAE